MKGSAFASTLAFVIAIVVAVSSLAVAQAGVRVLVVDETKTLASTMRVAGLVGMLKGMGPFEVAYRLADVESSWDDPLAGAEPDGVPYDLIIVVPRGIDDGSADWIWIVSNGLLSLPPVVRSGIDLIDGVIGRVFGGGARPVGLYDDFLLSFLSALYVNEGWLR